ncbi:hypothetical protein E5161_20265 [Cohnella pontilimi]|uniref:YxlC family protein n=1 Tax=Cohnella pontilimi TaxID=2564100 RepID=A0A4V5LRA4_9BACL|nr:DUF5345 family protein [Cohnella pontilimi]TJY38519.1 hypothetical protein E5161_20265 [Cohnella pontilimi]
MTKPTDDGKHEEQLIQALQETWSNLDRTFETELTPLPDWEAVVREQRRSAKRKMWKELAILWSVAIPVLGMLFFLATGMLPLLIAVEAAATAAAVPLLIGEIKRMGRTAKGRS